MDVGEVKSGLEMVKKRSLIRRYFPMDLYIELTKVTMMGDIDNNEKGKIIKELLTQFEVPYTPLGSGTNRMAVLIDGYAVKISLDSAGCIDNRREFKYSEALQPYVVKVYECTPNGLVAVTEYISIFEYAEFQKYKEQMKRILADISRNFLVGDVGITSRNYVNWGTRNDGSICILDFAYIYTVRSDVFQCNCEKRTYLTYDDDYVMLRCRSCGRGYTFGDIRKRITKAKQESEIGNIREIGYEISEEEQLVPRIEEFEPMDESSEKKKHKKKLEADIIIEEYKRQKRLAKEQNWDYPDEEKNKSVLEHLRLAAQKADQDKVSLKKMDDPVETEDETYENEPSEEVYVEDHSQDEPKHIISPEEDLDDEDEIVEDTFLKIFRSRTESTEDSDDDNEPEKTYEDSEILVTENEDDEIDVGFTFDFREFDY